MIHCPACGAWIMVPSPRRPRTSEVVVVTHEDLADLPDVAARRGAVRQRRKSARPRPRHTRLRATHVGKKCPYCLSQIKPQGQMVVCPECGIPHHPECWEENGGCTTWGCTAAPRRGPQAVVFQVPRGPTGQADFEALNRLYSAYRRAQVPVSRPIGPGAGAAIAGMLAAGLFLTGLLLYAQDYPGWYFFILLAVFLGTAAVSHMLRREQRG